MNTEIAPQRPMFELAGGIGAGKSSAGEVLLDLGAKVIDADRVAAELREPGQPGYVAMIDILGDEIVSDDGTLDRKRIAATIFGDDGLRIEVEQAVHPMVWSSIFDRIQNLQPEDIPVVEIPLLKPEHRDIFDGIVVVNTEQELAIDRLANGGRNVTREEAEARIKAQMTNEERIAIADYVIDNNGTYDEFVLAIGGAWGWIQQVFHA